MDFLIGVGWDGQDYFFTFEPRSVGCGDEDVGSVLVDFIDGAVDVY